MKSNVRESKLSYYDARIYVGAKEGGDGPEITREKLLEVIAEFQKTQMVPVRITPTTYLAGEYVEDGYEIGITAFSVHEREAERFAIDLANHLLHSLKQSKVGLAVTSNGAYVGQFDGGLIFLEDLNKKCC